MAGVSLSPPGGAAVEPGLRPQPGHRILAAVADPVRADDTFGLERTFTEEDVAAFAEVSGDRGRHHVEPDGRGRVLVHGLLVASLPTRLGGDIHYIARTMTWEFLRPVFTGDTVRCELTIDRADPAEGRLDIALTAVCRNQDGREVLRGDSRGVILQVATG
jgi:3-hydroxybutyryl-CoA dehydratase